MAAVKVGKDRMPGGGKMKMVRQLCKGVVAEFLGTAIKNRSVDQQVSVTCELTVLSNPQLIPKPTGSKGISFLIPGDLFAHESLSSPCTAQ